MIAKKYRLSEREIRKVFRGKKPFFSSMFIANVASNSCNYPRFAIFLSGKVAPGSVNRNVFRRMFYDISSQFLLQKCGYDIVLVAKKGRKFYHKNPSAKEDFCRDICFLYQKIFSSHE